jgi:hypothetical protein
MAGGVVGGHVHQVGFEVVECLRWDVDAVVDVGGGGSGASLALPGLVHVALGRRVVDEDVATNAFRGEARKSFKVTFINRID